MNEEVAIEMRDGDTLIRRSAAHGRSRREAEGAAAEIIADSKKYSLGGISIRDLREEGRRG